MEVDRVRNRDDRPVCSHPRGRGAVKEWILSAVIAMLLLTGEAEAGGLGAQAASGDPAGAEAPARTSVPLPWAVGERIGLPRSDLLHVEIRQTNWGWIETESELEQLKTWYDHLRVSVPNARIELRNWAVSTDSLYGEVVRVEGNRLKKVPRAPPAIAAVPDLLSKPTSGGTCFRAQACPKCDWIVLLEFGMASSDERCGIGPFFSGDFGAMRNLSSRYGLGATFFYGGDDCGGRYGVRPRLRLWLAEEVGLDLGPGIVLGDDEDFSSRRYPAFSGQIALDMAGIIAPFFQVDTIRYQNGTETDSFVGLRMESYAAPAALVLLVLLAGATWD